MYDPPPHAVSYVYDPPPERVPKTIILRAPSILKKIGNSPLSLFLRPHKTVYCPPPPPTGFLWM